ncbi:hypothetical protein [Burkholderia sp. LMG 13014]|uniref:hypothetical protein n=1 Tax=Burkholderia sp. LMG 13014 TaxID=2709306 RepID=UPI00196565D4|nr:hypothetical protein [Burkholderia sp. LMG 13014]
MTSKKGYRDQQFLRPIRSVAAYLEAIYTRMNGSSSHLFRGHRCADWPLASPTFNGVTRLQVSFENDDPRERHAASTVACWSLAGWAFLFDIPRFVPSAGRLRRRNRLPIPTAENLALFVFFES